MEIIKFAKNNIHKNTHSAVICYLWVFVLNTWISSKQAINVIQIKIVKVYLTIGKQNLDVLKQNAGNHAQKDIKMTLIMIIIHVNT